MLHITSSNLIACMRNSSRHFNRKNIRTAIIEILNRSFVMAEEWYVEGVISKMFTIESKLFVAPRHLVAKSPSIDSVYEQNG